MRGDSTEIENLRRCLAEFREARQLHFAVADSEIKDETRQIMRASARDVLRFVYCWGYDERLRDL
jgi:hypothetical protein